MLQGECAGASEQFAAMRKRAETAEDVEQRMFREGTDKMAQFNKEFAELSVGVRNGQVDQMRIRELSAALEASKVQSEEQRLASEQANAALLHQLHSHLAITREKDAQLAEMAAREQKVVDTTRSDELQKQFDNLTR